MSVNQVAIQELKNLLKEESNDQFFSDKCSTMINTFTISEQLSIHGYLEYEELRVLFFNRRQLNIESDVLEHILWQYFRYVVNMSDVDTTLLELLINVYQETGFIALESIIIDLLDKQVIQETDVPLIQEKLDSEIIRLHILKYYVKKKIQSNKTVNLEEIKELIRAEQYKFILGVLKSGFYEEEVKRIFTYPTKGEKYSKIKKEIFSLLHSFEDLSK